MDISVVIPVYGCREAVPVLYERLVETLESLTQDFEIIMVDDRCPQDSWSEISRLCEQDQRLVGIRLSRNSGQMKAITAGLQESCGDWVVVMDCDLQDRPEHIRDLLEATQNGEYDIVFSKRKNRKDSFLVRALSRMYYRVYNFFSDMKYDFEVGNYSIAKRKVVDAFLRMNEQNRDYIMFLMWLGFNDRTIELDGDERHSGRSSYTFKKKIDLAVRLITEQSDKPLLISIKAGFIISLGALAYIVYLVLCYMIRGDVNEGWTSIVASIFLMGGLILCALGVAGVYIGNLFTEAKQRPLFVIDRIMNRHRNDGEDDLTK